MRSSCTLKRITSSPRGKLEEFPFSLSSRNVSLSRMQNFLRLSLKVFLPRCKMQTRSALRCVSKLLKSVVSVRHKMGNFSFRRTIITARSFRFLCCTHTHTLPLSLSLHAHSTLFLHPCQLRCMQFECTQFHIPRNAVNVC